jgi:hypothetical protein
VVHDLDGARSAEAGLGLGSVISGATTGGAISDAEGMIISPLQFTQSMGLPDWRTSAESARLQRGHRK